MKTVENSKKLIKFRPELFWDVDPNAIDPQKHSQYIIERVLELGDIPEVKWVTHYYPADLIMSTLNKSRVISDKSKTLWSMII
jgi:bacterioferritin (cytochrome b1)